MPTMIKTQNMHRGSAALRILAPCLFKNRAYQSRHLETQLLSNRALTSSDKNTVPSHSFADSRRISMYVFKFSEDNELPTINLPGHRKNISALRNRNVTYWV